MVLVIALAIRQQRGSYWMSSPDPDYAYLLNSLNFAELHGVGHTDHPGTPVQLWGALLLRTTHALAGRGSVLRADVLQRPEFYLTAISNSILVLYTVVLIGAGWITLSATGSLLYCVVLQLTPLLSPAGIFDLPNVKPEPFLMAIAVALSALVIRFIFAGPSANSSTYAMIFGLLIGLVVAVKFTALLLWLVPLAALPTWRSRLVYCVVCLLSFVLFVTPVLPRFGATLSFLSASATHSGRYGLGSKEVTNLRTQLGGLLWLLRVDLLMFWIAAVGCGVLILGRAKDRSTTSSSSLSSAQELHRGRVVLLTVVAIQVLQLLFFAKHPTPRYLVPVAALIGLNLVLTLHLARKQLPDAQWLWRMRFLMALTVAIGVLHAVRFGVYLEGVRNTRKARELIVSEVHKNFADRTVACYWGASSLEVALAFGNELALSRYSDELDAMYPNVIFYNRMQNRLYGQPPDLLFSNFRGIQPVSDVLAQHPRMLFQGPPLGEDELDLFAGTFERDGMRESPKLEIVYPGLIEALYQIHERP